MNNLVRLEDTPISAMYWYYFTHPIMRCPKFIVWRYEFTFAFTPMVLRRVRMHVDDWRGVYGSAGT